MEQTTFTILRTSARGAHLITDGTKQCWIQGRWLRPDGTLTRMGQLAWENARTTEDIEAECKAREEAREAARQAAREASKQLMYVNVKAEVLVGETEKALKCWSGSYQRLYGRVVKSYCYLPKSQVKVEKTSQEGIICLTMPAWVRDQNGWLGSFTVGWGIGGLEQD